MPTAKTYTPLAEISRAPIARCSQILPNRLQCWKAGEIQVEEEVPSATGLSAVTYQLCKMHAIVQQSADELARKAEADGDEKQAEDASNLLISAPPPGTPTVPPNQAETDNLSNTVKTPGGVITSPPAGSFHEQLLQTLGEKQQTVMPQGEDSPNNQ